LSDVLIKKRNSKGSQCHLAYIVPYVPMKLRGIVEISCYQDWTVLILLLFCSS